MPRLGLGKEDTPLNHLLGPEYAKDQDPITQQKCLQMPQDGWMEDPLGKSSTLSPYVARGGG